MDGPAEAATRDISPKKSIADVARPNQSLISMLPSTQSAAQQQQQSQFRVNVCQRVEPPKDLNTPAREDDDAGVIEEIKGVHGEGVTGNGKAGTGSFGVNRRQASNTKMRDQEMLAFACRRYVGTLVLINVEI
jgi:hypothetical protein